MIALVMVFREPGFFLHPQLWAEEGSVYFQYAYQHSWGDALLAPHLGYYSLFTNLSSLVAAKLLPLDAVPLFFVLVSMLIQLIPFLLILGSSSAVWDRFWKKLIGCGIVLFTLYSAEIWLNTINSQFYFSLMVFLILLEDLPVHRVKQWCFRALLLVAGLTGVVSLFLLPVFAIRSFLDRQRERLVQTWLLFGVMVFQGLVFFATFTEEALYYTRFQGLDLFQLPQIIMIRSLFLPFLGPDISQYLSESVFLGGLSPLISLIVMSLFLIVFSNGLPQKERLLFVGSFLSLEILSVIGSLGETSAFLGSLVMAQRYFYAPNVILVLMVFRNVQYALESRNRVLAGISTVLVCLSLSMGMWYFRTELHYEKSYPVWSHEIRQWHENPDYEIRISPPGWRMSLSGDR